MHNTTKIELNPFADHDGKQPDFMYSLDMHDLRFVHKTGCGHNQALGHIWWTRGDDVENHTLQATHLAPLKKNIMTYNAM